jgi:hypothetical protein
MRCLLFVFVCVAIHEMDWIGMEWIECECVMVVCVWELDELFVFCVVSVIAFHCIGD